MGFLAPFVPQLVGAAVGGGMGLANQRAAEEGQKRDEMANALETQYSPWLGAHYRPVRHAGSALGQGLGGAFMGAMQGGNIAKSFNKPNSGWGFNNLQKGETYTGAPMSSQYNRKPGFRSRWQDPSNYSNLMNA